MSLILKEIDMPKLGYIPVNIHPDGSIEVIQPDDSWKRIPYSAIQIPKDPIAVKPGETVIFDKPIQIEKDKENLIKMTYCRGFNDGFEHAQEVISRYVKAVGYNIIIPKDLYDVEEP